MSPAQIPLLLLLLLSLAIVVALIVRQVRSEAPTARRRPAASGRSSGGRENTAVESTAPESTPPAAGRVASWGYQLQNLQVARAAASPFDLLVIDTTRDGSDDTALTTAELITLQRKSDGSRRRVLAYLSIGEAERYRSYWEPSWQHARPDWLLGENPEWKENYAVCFWDDGWQSLLCGSPEARLDRLIAAGFDGVYLDKCDVFDDLKRRYRSKAATRSDIEGDMVNFIARLASYARSKKPGFLVVMQNAEELLARPELRATLDGIAKEELVYGAQGPEKLNSADDVEHTRDLLDLMRSAGKMVLVVEYLDDQAKIRHAVETVRPLGYTLYISPRNRKLDRLNPALNPALNPDVHRDTIVA